jgi:N-acetylglucosaminyl-diphospho-decaprenol L-rhamnosyltransferase
VRFARGARVAIIIPVHNSGEHVWRSLDVLRRMTLPKASVVVVDDGSTDATWERLAAQDDVDAVKADGTLWWSGAVDLGSRRAIEDGAEVVILWNDDNLDASPDVISQLATAVLEHGCCASPVVLDFPISSAPRIAQAGGVTRWRDGGLRLRRVGEAYEVESGVESCDWLSGQVLAFPADIFPRVGGFDSRRFPQYRGDADFTIRAAGAGTRSRVLLSCWVANETRRTGLAFYARLGVRDFFRGLVSRRSNYEVRSTVRFYWRHAPRSAFLPSITLFYAKYVYAFLKTWLRTARA